MGFADVLKLYLNKMKCTAKELSAASGMLPTIFGAVTFVFGVLGILSYFI